MELDSHGWPLMDWYNEIVLRSSSQCLPMIIYDREIIKQAEGRRCIDFIQTSLQQILDFHFNEGLQATAAQNHPLMEPVSAAAGATNPLNMQIPGNRPIFPTQNVHGHAPRAKPARGPANMSPAEAMAHEVAYRNNNLRKRTSAPSECLYYSAPMTLTAGIPPNALAAPQQASQQSCTICCDTLANGSCVALNKCGHTFHKRCLHQSFLRMSPKCPVCRISIGPPQGKSPSGSMTVSVKPELQCSGYQDGTIQIKYNIPSGKQMPYHENPGSRHSSKNATAYLPNNTSGQDLLKRLKYAFMHGLSFTVGASIKTGRKDQCTWASIHHKTSAAGGVEEHGFPDPNYFVNCNKELDGLGVPPANLLANDGCCHDAD